MNGPGGRVVPTLTEVIELGGLSGRPEARALTELPDEIAAEGAAARTLATVDLPAARGAQVVDPEVDPSAPDPGEAAEPAPQAAPQRPSDEELDAALAELVWLDPSPADEPVLDLADGVVSPVAAQSAAAVPTPAAMLRPPQPPGGVQEALEALAPELLEELRESVRRAVAEAADLAARQALEDWRGRHALRLEQLLDELVAARHSDPRL